MEAPAGEANLLPVVGGLCLAGLEFILGRIEAGRGGVGVGLLFNGPAGITTPGFILGFALF